MRTEVFHDYRSKPVEEAENCVQALKDSEYEHLETIFKEKNIGMDTVHLGIVVYEGDDF